MNYIISIYLVGAFIYWLVMSLHFVLFCYTLTEPADIKETQENNIVFFKIILFCTLIWFIATPLQIKEIMERNKRALSLK